MIIVRIWGGIGNQLFQYVFGQYLQEKYNQDVYYDDNSYVSVDILRKRELDCIIAEIRYNNSCSFSKVRGICNRILRFFYQLLPSNHFIEERGNFPNKFKKTHKYFIQGYWQNYSYYKWLRQNDENFSIVSRSTPPKLIELKNQIFSAHNSVSIHIRRGDYFLPQNIKKYGVCDTQYFVRAISEITRRIGSCNFFVFSDDLEWVRQNVKMPEDTVFVPNYDVSQFSYIELMSFCNHHIISNSSFSWWGAVLNESPNAIVIAPQKWTLDSENTIALDKWIKL